MTDAALIAAASALAGEPLRALEPVRGGGNNRLYRAHGAQRSYALKCYPDDPDDARERYSREHAALALLWRRGETRVPQPLGLNEERRLALFAWVDGTRIVARAPGDVDDLAAFAVRLYEIRSSPGVADLEEAREAVHSSAELQAQLAWRIARLRGVAPDHPQLASLLADIERLAGRGPGGSEPRLERDRQTLSPSDFGLHNALRTGVGIVFLDFEYFGWDDPVKLVADVLWHPGMELDAREAQKFYGRVADVYGVDRSFGARFERDAPLYGLRWALIVLNEFVPAIWQRRVDAGETAERGTVLAAQFAKASRLVERARTGSPLA